MWWEISWLAEILSAMLHGFSHSKIWKAWIRSKCFEFKFITQLDRHLFTSGTWRFLVLASASYLNIAQCIVWYKFTDISEVLTASITRATKLSRPVCLEEMQTTKSLCQDSWLPGWDLNPQYQIRNRTAIIHVGRSVSPTVILILVTQVRPH